MTKKAVALVFFSTLIPGIIFRGYALSILWGWFVTKLGIREIGTAEAIGICMLIYLVAPSRPTNQSATSTDDERLQVASVYLGNAFFGPIFALAMGWIIKAFT